MSNEKVKHDLDVWEENDCDGSYAHWTCPKCQHVNSESDLWECITGEASINGVKVRCEKCEAYFDLWVKAEIVWSTTEMWLEEDATCATKDNKGGKND